jgi:hypothetical protein
MFIIKQASPSEGVVGAPFDTAADAHYYLLKHLRRRYRHRGYDEAKHVYWAKQNTDTPPALFTVMSTPRSADDSN